MPAMVVCSARGANPPAGGREATGSRRPASTATEGAGPSGNASQGGMFRDAVGNECRGTDLLTHRMLTPQAHPMNDGLSLYPQAGAVSYPGTSRQNAAKVLILRGACAYTRAGWGP
jgi:hypothetical protein